MEFESLCRGTYHSVIQGLYWGYTGVKEIMQYEIYLYLEDKPESFYKAAMAEYEKRLSRYCKLSVKYIKKEKELDRYLSDQEEAYVIMPGKVQMSSEELSQFLGEQENRGSKKITFFILGDRIRREKAAWLEKEESLHSFSLSLFDMAPSLEGLVLEEQIYRAYRILNHHPYHK